MSFGDELKLVLPAKYNVAPSWIFEFMIDELCEYYHAERIYIETHYDIADYYEMVAFRNRKTAIQNFILEESKKKNKKRR